MLHQLMRAAAILLTFTFLTSQSPLTWATPRQTPTEQAPSPVPPTESSHQAPERRGASLSEERRAHLAVRELNNGDADDYEGGVAIYIGGGVLLVALIVVALLVVD
jgi:hypothetical protein